MCTRPFTKVFPPSVHDRLVGLSSCRTVQLPCGKCAECLKKRQNDLATRVYREAKDKHCCTFVTLTYRPEDVPLAQSHWRCDKITGEFERVTFPEIIVESERLAELRNKIHFNTPKGSVGEADYDMVSLSEMDKRFYHICRVTPTLYYEDVKKCLKRFRYYCKKPFTYVCCGEYGMSDNGEHRPHYHLIFFGLYYRDVLSAMQQSWPYGNIKVQGVLFKNRDGSDGLAKVSRYVGKYCAKGVFDIYTQRQGCTLRNRLRSSKGLGSNLYKEEKDWFLAKDVYEYDENNPHVVPEDILDKITDTIIERSKIEINGFPFRLPLNLIRKIYDYKSTESKSFERPKGFKGKNLEIFEKHIYSPIYYIVADKLRSQSAEVCSREFEQFISNSSSENISDSVASFERHKEIINEARELSAYAGIKKFYSNNSKL